MAATDADPGGRLDRVRGDPEHRTARRRSADFGAARALLNGAGMKPTKIIMSVAGVLGLLAVFALPYISVEGFSMKFWDFRQMPEGLTSGLLNGPKQVYVALLGFGLVLAIGAQAIVRGHLARWGGIVGAVGCLLAFATEGVRKGLAGGGEGMSTAIGGKLLFIAAIVGLVASVAGAVKPETK